MPDTLKPCPFCGSPAELDPEGQHWAMCSSPECHQHYGAAPTPSAWNRRAPSPEAERLVLLVEQAIRARWCPVLWRQRAEAALAAYKEAQRHD